MSLLACEHDATDATSSTATGGATTSTSTSISSTASTSASSSTDASSSSAGGSGGASSSSSGTGGAPACNTVTTVFPLEASPHTMLCESIAWNTNPPTSGPHFPNWAAFKTYTAAVPRGFWVHDLEHGAVVLTYNCPSGCDAELAELTAWIATLPVDPLCVAPLQRRVVVTPDPLIPSKFAASAWGASLTSDCVDVPALDAFYAAHYAMATENTCADGIDPLNPPVCP